MSTVAVESRVGSIPPALFPATVFASAALVFAVQPMVARLILPLLGGSPSVWNTSMAFFQIALLVGYGYAHALQRLKRVKSQAIVHCAVLALAALALPLRVNGLAGEPSSDHPNLWLLAVLTLSVGAPFAALSATAPLVQAWHARTVGAAGGKEPYALYAASNLGSLLALLAYPAVIEPLSTLAGQRLGWTVAYAGFGLLMIGLATAATRAGETAPTPAVAKDTAAAAPVTWKDRQRWIALAAIPCSLMLGVTAHLSTDVASAPFLWVAPLALYLLTFIIAFQARPIMGRHVTLVLQAAAVTGCAMLLPFRSSLLIMQLAVHLGCFFLTALMCHQALVARRPHPSRLTEFYLCMSLGGVVGGAFNAFLAPVIFDNVWEYPLVLALACLARPWNEARNSAWTWGMFILGVICAVAAPIVLDMKVAGWSPGFGGYARNELISLAVYALFAASMIAAFMVRGHGLVFFAVIAMLSFGAEQVSDRTETQKTWRSFFGVLKQSTTTVEALGGEVRMLAHGTTLHGAQATDPAYRCQPLVYYTHDSPIGQVIRTLQGEKSAVRIGAVGLGTGSVSAYVRPADHLTFFEIDPLVVRISTDPTRFTYTTECAKGRLDYVLGDARLTVAKQPPGVFDVLLIDAFSSDAVPAHLLTVEAVKGYLTRMKPDGVIILHLSNRNLDLMGPAQAVAEAAGGAALLQRYRPEGRGAGWESPEDAVIIARSGAALDRFLQQPGWEPTDPHPVRPWTDDYTNLAGALVRRMRQRVEGVDN